MRELLEAQPDAPLIGIDADDQQRQLVADVDDLAGRAHRAVGHLRDVQQAVHARLELDEGTEVRQAHHLARHARAHRIPLGHGRPRVGLDLLEAQGNPLVLLVDVEDLRLELLSLLQYFRRMSDIARPRHVGDVQQAVHPGLQLDEGAEVGQVAHLAQHAAAHAVALVDGGPRVGFHLLHAERDALGPAVDLEHHHLDLVADVDDLGGVAHPARPRHLGDVHEALDPGLQLDERAVVRQAHHAAAGLGARRVGLLDALPRVGRLLLVAERHAAALTVEVENNDFDLISDLEDLGRVTDTTPAHIGHVEEAIDAAQVDEGSIIRDVLHRAREHHALGQDFQRVLLLLLALLFQHGAAREHHVAAAAVELDDLGADRLADHGGQVLHRPQVHLRARQERLHADVDAEAALDDLHDAALDR